MVDPKVWDCEFESLLRCFVFSFPFSLLFHWETCFHVDFFFISSGNKIHWKGERCKTKFSKLLQGYPGNVEVTSNWRYGNFCDVSWIFFPGYYYSVVTRHLENTASPRVSLHRKVCCVLKKKEMQGLLSVLFQYFTAVWHLCLKMKVQYFLCVR